MPRVDILSKRKNARFDFFRGNKKTLRYAYLLKLPVARPVDELRSSRYGECARWSIFKIKNLGFRTSPRSRLTGS